MQHEAYSHFHSEAPSYGRQAPLVWKRQGYRVSITGNLCLKIYLQLYIQKADRPIENIPELNSCLLQTSEGFFSWRGDLRRPAAYNRMMLFDRKSSMPLIIMHAYECNEDIQYQLNTIRRHIGAA